MFSTVNLDAKAHAHRNQPSRRKTPHAATPTEPCSVYSAKVGAFACKAVVNIS